MSSALGDETAALLQQLIRQACVNDGTPASGQEMRNVAVLQEYFAGTGIAYEIVEPAPGRGNLVARILGTDPEAPTVALVGHLDVVPATEPELWTHDPFGGELIDGVVWGRGAVDMLGLTAAFAVVTKHIAASGEPTAGDLVFAAVADEEAGGKYGAGWLAANRPELISTDYALTENGGIVLGTGDAPGVTLTVGEKGGAPRVLTVRGKPGHGSVPWRSKNAAALAGEIVSRIAKSPGEPVVLEHWREFVGASGFDEALTAKLLDPTSLNGALDELGPLAGYAHAITHMTVSPNVLTAGDKANVIPGTATVVLDIRLLPGQDAGDVDGYLAETIGDLLDGGEMEVEVAAPFTAAASASPARSAFSDQIERAVGEHYPGAHLVPMVMPGGTDGRHLRALGATTYGFGLFTRAWDMATFRSVFHGRDERVDVASLGLTAETLYSVLRGFLR
jgi:acetylornithine deacetylase/succinyl-diaminopimelate desuccinylase-like protein